MRIFNKGQKIPSWFCYSSRNISKKHFSFTAFVVPSYFSSLILYNTDIFNKVDSKCCWIEIVLVFRDITNAGCVCMLSCLNLPLPKELQELYSSLTFESPFFNVKLFHCMMERSGLSLSQLTYLIFLTAGLSKAGI